MLLSENAKSIVHAEFLKLHNEKYKNALDFGINFINRILAYEGSVPLRLILAAEMLNRPSPDGGLHADLDAFEFLIQRRQNRGVTSLFYPNAAIRRTGEELQGYVDVTMMLLSICNFLNNNSIQQMLEMSQVIDLPKFNVDSGMNFIETNPSILEGLVELKLDFEDLVHIITAEAIKYTRLTYKDLITIEHGLSPTQDTVNPGWFYYRGALTAQDTYLLYYELFHGKLANYFVAFSI